MGLTGTLRKSASALRLLAIRFAVYPIRDDMLRLAKCARYRPCIFACRFRRAIARRRLTSAREKESRVAGPPRALGQYL